MGWLRDIVRIPDYVADANEEVNYMRELTAIMRIREKPAFNAMRFGGEIVMGWIFGFLARVAIPEELFAEYPSLKFVVDVVIPYASAVGRCHMSYPSLSDYPLLQSIPHSKSRGVGDGLGRHSDTEGGRTHVTYFAEEGVFLRLPHVRDFVKEGYFFVPRYEIWGSKSPYNPQNICGSDAE